MSLLLFLTAHVVVPAGETFTCTPERVWDGDGPLWCEEGPRIRLAGIAARELDETCAAGHPCPSAGGLEARDALVRLVGVRVGESDPGHVLVTGPAMRCVSTGSAGGKRTGAWCVSPKGGDLSCVMVQTGYAARWDRYWGNHSCS